VNKRRPMQIAGVVFTALAYASFTLMDSFPDYSTPQDALMWLGYALVAAALFAFFKAMRASA
jgi:hypothetical protein